MFRTGTKGFSGQWKKVFRVLAGWSLTTGYWADLLLLLGPGRCVKLNDMPEPTLPTRRRWFRFGLRSLLVFTALVGLLMGWIVKERRQSVREMEIAAELERQGWFVELGGPYDTVSSRKHLLSRRRLQHAAQQLLGDRIIALHAPYEAAANCSMLGLHNLRELTLQNWHEADLKILTQIESLELLEIAGVLPTQSEIDTLSRSLSHCQLKLYSATGSEIPAQEKSLPGVLKI